MHRQGPRDGPDGRRCEESPMPQQTFLQPWSQDLGGRLGYRRVGSGPTPVIALHDWRGDHRFYRQAIPVMDRRRFTHILADIRGYGLSFEAPGAFTIEEIADDVLRLADSLGFKRLHLVGHSLTAAACERVAASAPNRLYSLALLAPFRRDGVNMLRIPPQRLADHLEKSPFYRSRVPRRTSTITPPLFHTRQTYLKRLEDEEPLIVPGETPPTLIVVGARDPLVDINAVRATSSRHAKMAVIDTAGHFLVDDDPVRCIRTLQEFQLPHTPAGGAAVES